MQEEPQNAEEARQRLTEVGVGVTLIGVICNMGLTIGLGLNVPLVVRLPLAIGVPLLLIVALAFFTRRADLLATIPWWLTKHGPDPWERLTSDDKS